MQAPATLTAWVAIFAAAPAAYGQRGDDNGPADRCETTDCFNQLQIRRAEVVGETALIVYVGGQECPFLVDFNGTFCDLTFLPTQSLVFRPSRLGQARAAPVVGGRGTAPDGRGAIEQTRICASDINMGIETGPFTSAVGGGINDNAPQSGLACQIRTVRSLTDDERLQIYVDNEMAAPPPPFGTGRVEAPDNPEEPTVSQADEEEDSRSRRRRRRDREDDE